MDIGTRLREERERLGHTQDAFAAIAAIGKRALIHYEKGERSPDAVFLATISKAGADVLYILTGSRHPSAPAPVYAVSEGDRVMLENFHAAPPEVRAGVKATLGVFAPGGAAVKKRRGRAA